MRINITEVYGGFLGDIDPTPEEREELTERYEQQLRANLGADYPGAEIYLDWVGVGKPGVSVDLENGAAPDDIATFNDEQRIENLIHKERQFVWESLW